MADASSVPAWIPIVSAISGGLVVGIFGAINNYVNKKAEEKKTESEDRRHLRELLLKSAVEHWKQSSVVFVEKMKAGQITSLAPIDANIIHLVKLSELLLDPEITKENITEKLQEVHDVSNEVERFFSPKSGGKAA